MKCTFNHRIRRSRIGNIPASELGWISARQDLTAAIAAKELTYAGSPWKVTVKITSAQPIPGGQEEDGEAPAAPTPANSITSVVSSGYNQVDLQTKILAELKSINGKLTFFVVLAILAIIVQFLGGLLR